MKLFIVFALLGLNSSHISKESLNNSVQKMKILLLSEKQQTKKSEPHKMIRIHCLPGLSEQQTKESHTNAMRLPVGSWIL